MGDGQSEGSGGPQIDFKIEFRGLLERQFGRPRALQDAVDEICSTMATGINARSGSHEHSRVRSRRLAREAWQSVLHGEFGCLSYVLKKEWSLRRHNCLRATLNEC